VNRMHLVKAIHRRLGGSISYRRIYQAVGLIVDQVSNDLVNDQVVTAKRFGTLSPHVRRAHVAHNVSNGEIRSLMQTRSVKFHPHEAFGELIREREKLFRQFAEDKS
jgi:nucleoid DNA-binding protein